MNEQNPHHQRIGAVRGTAALVLLAGAFGAGAFFRDPLLRLVSTPSTMESKKDAAAQQLWTCSMHPQVIQDHPGFCPICHMALTPLSGGSHAATHSTTATATNVVVIDPAVVQRMGVRTAVAEQRKLMRMIRLVGEITEPEPNHVDVNLRVNGWIDKLYADADGKEMKKGEPLFDLYSPELSVAVDELIAARKQMAGGKDTSAESFFSATKLKLSRLGLTDSQIDSLAKLDMAPKTVPILSPMSGHVTEKKVVAGSAVKAGDPALRIADRSSMWAELQVYEQDLPFLSVGQTVAISTPSAPGKTYDGQISFIYPHLDMMSRSARMRVVVPNTDHVLHEGMYASAEVAATATDETVVVPREAVIDTGIRQLSFIALGEGKFQSKEVRIGASDGAGNVQVLSGLSAGDVVVTSGEFLIDAESRTQEAVGKMLAQRSEQAAAATQPAPMDPNMDMSANSNMDMSAKPASAGQRSATDTAMQKKIDAVVTDYLVVAKELGRVQIIDEPADVSALLADAHALEDTGIERAARAMVNVPIAEQRKQFAGLAMAVIRLVDQTPPSSSVGKSLVVLRCTMTNHSWIQSTDLVANPFFPNSMKECGEVTRRIELKGQGR